MPGGTALICLRDARQTGYSVFKTISGIAVKAGHNPCYPSSNAVVLSACCRSSTITACLRNSGLRFTSATPSAATRLRYSNSRRGSIILQCGSSRRSHNSVSMAAPASGRFTGATKIANGAVTRTACRREIWDDFLPRSIAIPRAFFGVESAGPRSRFAAGPRRRFHGCHQHGAGNHPAPRHNPASQARFAENAESEDNGGGQNELVYLKGADP